MEYTTVFEVTSKGNGLFFQIPLILFFFGIAFVFLNIKFNKSPGKAFKTVFGIAFSVFALSLVFIFRLAEATEKNEIKKIIENKKYKVVEGVIENYHPMPEEGHELEHFTVNGVYFSYSDYSVEASYNNTASHGGLIKRNGQKVRLTYFTRNRQNHIIKIEMKKQNNK